MNIISKDRDNETNWVHVRPIEEVLRSEGLSTVRVIEKGTSKLRRGDPLEPQIKKQRQNDLGLIYREVDLINLVLDGTYNDLFLKQQQHKKCHSLSVSAQNFYEEGCIDKAYEIAIEALNLGEVVSDLQKLKLMKLIADCYFKKNKFLAMKIYLEKALIMSEACAQAYKVELLLNLAQASIYLEDIQILAQIQNQLSQIPENACFKKFLINYYHEQNHEMVEFMIQFLSTPIYSDLISFPLLRTIVCILFKMRKYIEAQVVMEKLPKMQQISEKEKVELEIDFAHYCIDSFSFLTETVIRVFFKLPDYTHIKKGDLFQKFFNMALFYNSRVSFNVTIDNIVKLLVKLVSGNKEKVQLLCFYLKVTQEARSQMRILTDIFNTLEIIKKEENYSKEWFLSLFYQCISPKQIHEILSSLSVYYVTNPELRNWLIEVKKYFSVI